MKIIDNKNFIQFRGLVPIKKYKGPILKLTDIEKQKIKNLQEQITQLELELYNLQKFYLSKKLPTKNINYFLDKEYNIKCQIEDYNNQIRNIKISNINAQKA